MQYCRESLQNQIETNKSHHATNDEANETCFKKDIRIIFVFFRQADTNGWMNDEDDDDDDNVNGKNVHIFFLGNIYDVFGKKGVTYINH